MRVRVRARVRVRVRVRGKVRGRVEPSPYLRVPLERGEQLVAL